MKISEISHTDIRNVRKNIEGKMEGKNTLEEAGQSFIEELYNIFKESIVLVRMFVTIPISELLDNQIDFANNLASSADIPIPLSSDSRILTLVGTAGIDPDWNDRKKSKGHIAIPLATSDFVSAVPMLSALLEQLGFDLGWLRGDPDIVARKVGRMSGTFFVSDASTSKDNQDRLIIAFQDFVSQYNVKTVFGFGGGYAIGGKFIAIICFTKESIPQDKAVLFQGLANTFKFKTASLIKDKDKYFK